MLRAVYPVASPLQGGMKNPLSQEGRGRAVGAANRIDQLPSRQSPATSRWLGPVDI